MESPSLLPHLPLLPSPPITRSTYTPQSIHPFPPPTHLDAICIPLVIKMALSTELVWPSNVFTQLKSAMAHSLMVESPLAVATHYGVEATPPSS